MRRRDDNRQTFLSNSEDHYSKYFIRKCAIDVYDGRASVFCRDGRQDTGTPSDTRMTISRLIRLEPGEWRRQFSINNAHRYRKDGECFARIVRRSFRSEFSPETVVVGAAAVLLCFVSVVTIHAIWGRWRNTYNVAQNLQTNYYYYFWVCHVADVAHNMHEPRKLLRILFY